MSKELKCKIVPQRILYPRGKTTLKGEWGLVSAHVLKEYEVEGKLVESEENNIVISGEFNDLKIGINYNFSGNYKPYKGKPTYNCNYMLEDINLEKKEDQLIFLERMLTQTQYNALISYYENPFEIIKLGDESLLAEVNGIGTVTAKKILSKYEMISKYAKLYVELDKYKFTDMFINKLIFSYGDADTIINVVKKTPYKLIEEVENIGWKKADEIGKINGIPPESIQRIRGFIYFKLNELALSGCSWISTKELMSEVGKELKIKDKSPRIKGVKEMIRLGLVKLVDNNTKICLSKYYYLEMNISSEIKRLQKAQSEIALKNVKVMIEEIEENQKFKYNKEQKEYIQACVDENVVLLTGSAGSGKSITSKAIMNIAENNENTVIGCSLAGRAVQNLREYTGSDCRTIHRLLESGRRGFKINRNNPLKIGLYLIDELSMVNADLFYALIQSIPNGSKVIMLGDFKQLTSFAGIGQILKDVMDSKAIKHVNLTEIHRQAKKSGIISDSVKIAEGKQIFDKDFEGKKINGELKDMHYYVSQQKDNLSLKVVGLYRSLIKKNNLDLEDILVLSPLKVKGELSIYRLNNLIQASVNPPSPKIKEKELKFKNYPYTLRVGDRVKIKSNMEVATAETDEPIEVYNGNFGVLLDIEDGNNLIVEIYNGQKVVIPKDKIVDVILGYAGSVHSLQGSSSKYIIGAIDTTSDILNTRELIYTLQTRAVKEGHMICQNKAYRKAIKTRDLSSKKTFLKEFLIKGDDCVDENNA